VIGDVDPAAFAVSGAYTPVPGGVGALTIAMLMSNTVKAARLRRSHGAARG
jgi:methylenetetrahydrofolate dehydrogenase (NADP+)/methenyltetrahydrofolate cyclohydrolase